MGVPVCFGFYGFPFCCLWGVGAMVVFSAYCRFDKMKPAFLLPKKAGFTSPFGRFYLPKRAVLPRKLVFNDC